MTGKPRSQVRSLIYRTWVNSQRITFYYDVTATCIFTILVKFDAYFLRQPREVVFGVITDN